MTTVLGTEVTVTLVPMTCPVEGCGVTYGLDEGIRDRRRQDHGNWYCTNGHRLHFPGKSDAEKLQDELAAARRIAENERTWRNRAEQRERTAEYRRRAAQGQVTKIKRRVGRGVCPCCNRTFADLARHMAGQHPDFVDAD